jgi:hypothetical protein
MAINPRSRFNADNHQVQGIRQAVFDFTPPRGRPSLEQHSRTEESQRATENRTDPRVATLENQQRQPAEHRQADDFGERE